MISANLSGAFATRVVHCSRPCSTMCQGDGGRSSERLREFIHMRLGGYFLSGISYSSSSLCAMSLHLTRGRCPRCTKCNVVHLMWRVCLSSYHGNLCNSEFFAAFCLSIIYLFFLYVCCSYSLKTKNILDSDVITIQSLLQYLAVVSGHTKASGRSKQAHWKLFIS